jgi:hypothetical protein
MRGIGTAKKIKVWISLCFSAFFGASLLKPAI